MIFEEIKKQIKAGSLIPQVMSKGYEIKGIGKSRGEEALVYFIPNHRNPNIKNEKRVPASDWEVAYEYLCKEGFLNRDFFKEKIVCSKDGGCNYSLIGGVFSLLGLAEYDSENRYYIKK